MSPVRPKRPVIIALGVVVCFVASIVWTMARRSGGKLEGFSTIPPPSRVLVIMYSTPNIMEYAGLAEKINKAYCDRHGYVFKHVIGDQDDTSMRPVWKKVFLARDEIRNFDAVFWIDSDAIFNDHSKPLPLGGDEDFLVSSDFPNGPSLVNTGAFLVKSTPFGRDFMDRWCRMMTKVGSSYNSKFPFEQGACEDLIRMLGNEVSKVRVAPAEEINSIFGKVSRGQFDGLFIAHLMACPTEYRKMVFSKWLEQNGSK